MEEQIKMGDTFTFRKSTLKVEPAQKNGDGSYACEGCYFFENGLGCYNDYVCMSENRDDKTNVIFREVRRNDMSTEKRYIHKKICVCRSCKGTGKIVIFERYDILKRNPKLLTCTQCGGTGRVVVQGETTISVEPFNPEQDG